MVSVVYFLDIQSIRCVIKRLAENVHCFRNAARPRLRSLWYSRERFSSPVWTQRARHRHGNCMLERSQRPCWLLIGAEMPRKLAFLKARSLTDNANTTNRNRERDGSKFIQQWQKRMACCLLRELTSNCLMIDPSFK